MNSVETVLTEAVPTGDSAVIPAPGLRHGDIEAGSVQFFVGGFEQQKDAVEVGVDYQNEVIHAKNLGPNPWAAGAKIEATWEGVPLEATVLDHETRIDALEAGGGTGGGGTDPALEARVAALETEVDNHKWQLVGHESRITNNYNSIQNHEARLDALEAVLAKAAPKT